MRKPDRLTHKPSGFWLSSKPAKGGAYRYRMLLIGLAVLLLSAIPVVRLLRRASRARTDSSSQPLR